jgi:hypothetical protein
MIRLSHSAKEKYEQCPYKYYLHYVMKYRSSLQSSALCFGNALDIALNTMLEGGSNYHEVFDYEWNKYEEICDSIEFYKSDLDKSLLTESELQLSEHKQNFLSLSRKGRKLLDAYKENIMPRIKEVISIQGEVTICGYDDQNNQTEDSIYGKLDLIALIEDDDGKIRHALLDNKTTSEPYPKDAVQKKDQLALYAAGFSDIEWFGYLTLNKKNFKTQIILDKIGEDKKQEVLGKFVDTLNKIKDNQFEKNTKSCYAFGRRCEFWTHCHKGFFSKDIYQETKEK